MENTKKLTKPQDTYSVVYDPHWKNWLNYLRQFSSESELWMIKVASDTIQQGLHDSQITDLIAMMEGLPSTETRDRLSSQASKPQSAIWLTPLSSPYRIGICSKASIPKERQQPEILYRSYRDLLFDQIQDFMEIDDNIQIDLLKVRKDGFLNIVDKNYFTSYVVENLMDLLKRESKNIFENHFNKKDEYQINFGSMKDRAYVIDKLFSIASTPQLEMTDKGIIYQSISIFDRFYNKLAFKYSVLNPEEKMQNFKNEAEMLQRC